MEDSEICVEHANILRHFEITLVVGNLLERILRDSIYAHLAKHGFVQGRSCLINLIEFFKVVTKVINEGRAVDVVYMDFSKAFDKGPYGMLIQKIKMLGIHDNFAWIQNWLAHKRQRVV
eukprot:g36813.t1